MAEQVRVEIRDGVAVLTLDRPPANALAPSLRKDIFTRISQVIEDPNVQSIVLCGAGAAFCPGVDLGEYDGPLDLPWVGDICALIEDAPKPIVVSIQGLALGAGLEIALAAHGRIARDQTKLGMPEVTLGLIPGGGATQRMPRLVGAQTTLEILLSGQTVDVGNRRLATMFDRITPDPPVEAAIALAKKYARAGNWTRTRDLPQGLSDPSGFRKAIAAVEEKLKDPASAEADIVSCVEAALLLPFDRGLEFEASRFQDRIHSPLARGIRHSFVATRRARSMPETASGRPTKVSRVALIGTSPLVGELVLFCLSQGLDAVILGASSEDVNTLLSRLRALMDNAVDQGSVSAAERDVSWSKISAVTDSDRLSEAELILDLGSTPFDAPPMLKPTAVWAVVNQARPTAERAAETGTQGRIVALRVYRPADRRTLMELAVPTDTSDDAVATIFGCLASNERSVIRSVEIPGMLGVNMMAAAIRAGLALVAGGADPFDIDRAAQQLGLAVGPFERLNQDGLARSVSELENLCAAKGQHGGAGMKLARAMKAAHNDAQDAFQGFYEGTDRHARGDVLNWLRLWRDENASVHTDLPDFALATALHAALVNEAARLIDARAVLRPSDIDLAMVRGFGFESRKGGPLLQADINGVLSLLRAMKTLAALDTEVWSPHPLLEEMVKYGRRFF